MLPARRVIRFLLVVVAVGGVLAGMLYLRQGTISGPFALEASEQWLVRQDQPGQIVARHSTGRREIAQRIQVYQFPREDMIDFTVMSDLSEGTLVTSGTRIIEIRSMVDGATERTLVARTNKIETYLRHLQGVGGMDRMAAAEQALNAATTNLANYRPMLERRRELVKQGLFSTDELQLMEDDFNRRKQQLTLARADFEVRRMQLVSGDMSLLEVDLEEARQELNLVRERIESRWLVTPIPGRLTRFSGVPEMVLRVVNEHELTARVVLPVAFADQWKPGTPVELIFTSMGVRSVTSHVERVEINAVPMMGQSVAHLLVPVPNDDLSLRMAMTGQAVVKGIKTSPMAALWWRLRLAGFGNTAGDEGK